MEISIQDIPKSLQGFRMAQITDLHVGTMITGKYVEKVSKILNNMNPDMGPLPCHAIKGVCANNILPMYRYDICG